MFGTISAALLPSCQKQFRKINQKLERWLHMPVLEAVKSQKWGAGSPTDVTYIHRLSSTWENMGLLFVFVCFFVLLFFVGGGRVSIGEIHSNLFKFSSFFLSQRVRCVNHDGNYVGWGKTAMWGKTPTLSDLV